MKGLIVFFVIMGLLAVGLLVFDYMLLSDTKGHFYRSGELMPSDSDTPDNPLLTPTPAGPQPPAQPLVGPPASLKPAPKH